MKKIVKIIPIILIAIIVVIAVGTVMANTFDSQIGEDKKYTFKYAYDDRDDGWKIAFKVYLYSNGKNSYSFNGYNLKYDELEGFYIPVVDSKTGNVIEKIKPNAITLSVSDEYSNDILEINNYFNEKQFVDSISLADLADLSIKKVNKEYLVELFNKGINSEELVEEGKYSDSTLFNRVEVESTDSELEGTWRLSYILDYGYVSDIYIDFIYKNGEYLRNGKKQDKSVKNTILEITSLENLLISKFNQEGSNIKEKNSNNSSILESYVESIDSNLSSSDIQILIEKTLNSLSN